MIPEAPKDPQFHFQWFHAVWIFLGLSPAMAFKKVRGFIWGILKLKVKEEEAQEEKKAEKELVTMAQFKEHKDGDAKTLSAILSGLDQNSRIVQDAAIQVENRSSEMRETAELIRLSMGQQREETERKLSEVHEKVNRTNDKVSTLTGQLEILIPFVQNQVQQQSKKVM